MRKILGFVALVLVVATVAAPASAVNPREYVLTADGGGSITTGLYFWSGPSRIDTAANGTATIKFIWFDKNATERVEANIATGKAAGGAVWVLRDYTGPRSFPFNDGAPDSFYVDLQTATEVIVSW